MDLSFEDNPQDGRTRSGKARMSKLNSRERSELAKKAAAARWKSVGRDEGLRTASTDMGEIRLADSNIVLPCAVLDDGTRVLTQGGFLTAIGRRGKPKNTYRETENGVTKVPVFLAAENLKEFISDELRNDATPVPFRLKGEAGKAWGYRADLLPKVCMVYLRARDADKLLESQKSIAAACDILIRGFAQIGIIALVDEATGYQTIRPVNALARILEAFIAKELQPYVPTFPSAYYEHLFRLRGLDYKTDSVQRPQYFGWLTNDIVYKRLAPNVLAELKKVVRRNEVGRPVDKLFQRLTGNIGYPKLREHLGAVVATMKLSNQYGDFMEKLDRIAPRYGQNMLLPFNDGQPDSGKGI